MCLSLLALRYPLHNMKVTEVVWEPQNSNIGNALRAVGYEESQARRAAKKACI